jgi:hypothetical protein
MRDNGQVEENMKPWKFRSIKWRQVFRRQDHANLILTLALILAVILVTYLCTPRVDVYFIYDGKFRYN